MYLTRPQGCFFPYGPSSNSPPIGGLNIIIVWQQRRKYPGHTEGNAWSHALVREKLQGHRIELKTSIYCMLSILVYLFYYLYSTLLCCTLLYSSLLYFTVWGAYTMPGKKGQSYPSFTLQSILFCTGHIIYPPKYWSMLKNTSVDSNTNGRRSWIASLTQSRPELHSGSQVWEHSVDLKMELNHSFAG